MHDITAYVGLGSNLGDRDLHLRRALERLAATPGITVVRVSETHESALVGEGPAQGPFLNAVAELDTALTPAALLAVCHALEREAGRELPAPRNHPRPLDLDIIAYGDESIDTDELVVPHPRWSEREFVTVPLRQLGVDTGAWPRPRRPELIESAGPMAALSGRWRVGNCVIGLVPTMGALHDGHRTLIERCRAECDRVLVSIFVNPLQFGPGEDFAAYPRALQRDVEVCRSAGADAVFAPTPDTVYPAGFCSRVAVGRAAEGMEGAIRPDHFAGVATVVAKLFALCQPQRAYFGEKDAQQVAVVRRMTADFGFPVQIVPCEIVREPDGLAMSSRNVYLEPGDRAASTVLFRALSRAQQTFAAGERDRDALLDAARAVLGAQPRAALDYLELRAEPDLAPLPAGPTTGGRMLVAARFTAGERTVRLIDNVTLAESPA